MRPIAASALLLLCALLGGAAAANAQDPSDALMEVRLRDGSVLYGRVLDEGPPLRLRLAGGDLVELDTSRLRSVRPAPGRVRRGEYWAPDPNATRLFFGPTARTPPAGSGYLALYEIVMPFVSYSPSDRLVLAGGTPFFGGLGDARPYWVAPKLRVLDSGPTSFALGVLAFRVDGDDFGIVYGVATRGSGDGAVTLGLGYGYDEDGWAGAPAAMVGLEGRVSRTTKLLAEGYVFGGEALAMGGVRFFGERLSADLGLASLLSGDPGGVVPVVNFVYTW